MDLNISGTLVKKELCRRWTAKAVELALMGHWDEAVQANLQILDLFPETIEARNRLGKAYLELGRHEEAAAAYEQNLQKQPSNMIARNKLTELYALLNRDSETALQSAAESDDTQEDEEASED